MEYEVNSNGIIKIDTSMQELHRIALFRAEAQNKNRLYGALLSITPQEFLVKAGEDEKYNRVLENTIEHCTELCKKHHIKKANAWLN